MHKASLSLFILFLLSCKETPKNTDTSISLETIQNQLTVAETKQLLFTLAADSMKGRDSKNGGYQKAADFVANYFNKHHIEPFYPQYRDSLVTDSLISFNIVGNIGTFNPAKKTILIGAHLDHVGIRGNEGDTIYNGANDNATGSTAVLQIGAFLAQFKWEQNVLFALFADEEKGLKGAHHLAERLKNEKIKLEYMINFEMIGKTLTTGTNQVYMTGFKRSNMPEVMNRISPNFVQFLPQAKEYNLFKRSDNYAFFQKLNIPAHTLSSFDFQNYEYYHKPEDQAEKMDVENMNQIIQTAAYTIANMLLEKSEIKPLALDELN